MMNNNKLFSALTEEDLQYLESVSENKTLKKNQIIFEEKSKCNGLFVVKEGKIKRFIQGVDGRECIFDVCGPGEIFGHRNLFINDENFDSSVTITDAEIVFIPKKAFLTFIKKYDHVNEAYIQLLGLDSIKHIRHAQIISQLSLRQRMAYYLLYLQSKNKHADNWTVEISREDLANLLGTVKESAVRILHEFKEDQTIVSSGRRIQLLKPQELKKVCKVPIERD